MVSEESMQITDGDKKEIQNKIDEIEYDIARGAIF